MPTDDPSGSAVRQANAAACLSVLRDRVEPLTIAELAVATGLSRPTVSVVIDGLVEHGPVRLAAARQSPGAGRPARAYRFDPEAGRVAAIDVGGGRAQVWVADLAGALVGRAAVPVPAETGAVDRIRVVAELVRTAVADSGAEPGGLRGVGVGVPGILDHQGRITRSLAVPDWIGVDLPEQLATLLDCPVMIENDIKLAALAEQRLRDDGGDLVFLQLGHRISAALIMNGAILQGSHRLAGELGSLRGMRWAETSVRGRLRWRTARTGREVFARAADGDRHAVGEVDDFCAEIAPKIATLALTVDPQSIIIGGGLSRAGDTLIRPLAAAIQHMLMTDDKPVVKASRLTSEGTLCGALGAAFEHHSAAIFGVPGVRSRWQAWADPPAVTVTSTTASTRSAESRPTTRMTR